MKKYISNFNWLFFDKFLKLAGGFFVGIWVARYLGPNDFGILSFATAFISFFTFMASGGIRSIAIREMTKNPQRQNDYIGTIIAIMFFGGIASILLVVVGINLLKPDDGLLKLIVFISSLLFLFQIFTVIDFFNQSRVLSKYTVLASNVAMLIAISAKIFLIMGEYSVVYFAIANLLDVFFTGVFLVYFYKKQGFSVRLWRFDKSIAISIIKDSWPLAISMFLITIHKNIDQLMIEDMMSMADVGLYAVSVRLSEFWYFIPTIIGSTLMPYFINLRDRDEKMYLKMLMGLSSLLFWFAVGVATFFTIFAREIILMLFGEAYLGASDALIWSVWGGTAIAMGVPWSIWQISENLQLYRLYAQVMAVMLNVSLNLWLIPIMGIAGAAIATSATYMLTTWLFGQFFPPMKPAIRMMIRSGNPYHAVVMLRYIKNRRR
ncbi:flippase [Wolinella succinogenes]|uniref:flippase n=1 Tax=Wolinella succinogenes TaxID=844 RepID=UPI002FCBFBB4